MGGGSWCNVSCKDVNKDLPKIEVNSAIEPSFEEMTDYIVINDVPQMYVGILANFLPYPESRYEIRIFSKYNAANQRKILRQMYSSFRFDKENVNNPTSGDKCFLGLSSFKYSSLCICVFFQPTQSRFSMLSM